MRAAVIEWGPYLVLILVGFLPNEVWRVVGLLTARGLNEDSELVIWSRTVATALLAGVIAKLILFSSGELANIPLQVRIGAAVCALGAYFGMKRSVFAGVIAGEVALLLGGFFFPH
jgi:Branched-chain amino acid transport protein (AzlD)